MLATYMLLWKKDGGENNLQPFSPTTIIVTMKIGPVYVKKESGNLPLI